MGSEYFINSQELEDKVRNLLPSQGGAGAGFDLSASTQIIPIIDLTESAEGSNVRQDLQTALSLSSVTAFAVGTTVSTIINNTGYFRVFGSCRINASGSAQFNLTDGVTTKQILLIGASTLNAGPRFYDFIVFIKAGDSLTGITSSANVPMNGVTRQIADIDGNLVNP
jgi:hypothetical protein